MSLDSSLYIDAAIRSADVRDTLLRTGQFAVLPDDARGQTRLAADGVLVVCMASPTPQSLDEFGIRARTHLYFANTDKEQTWAWTLNSVRAVMAMLHAVRGDALFIYCSDTPALLRRSGAMVLDPSAGLWQPGIEPSVLPLVDLDYRFAPIPMR